LYEIKARKNAEEKPLSSSMKKKFFDINILSLFLQISFLSAGYPVSLFPSCNQSFALIWGLFTSFNFSSTLRSLI